MMTSNRVRNDRVPQGDLDEAFGFAVGAGRIGASEAMLEPELPSSGSGRPSLVGEQSLEVDAKAGVAGKRLLQEGLHRFLGFVEVDGGKGDSGVVVDGNMHVLAAAAADGVTPVAGHKNADSRFTVESD